MAISRVHTWSAGEVLLASDLNAEYNNILSNASDLVSPFTKAISMGGFALNLDAANTIALTAATNGVSLTGGAFNTPQGADIATASTLNLDTATGNTPDVTGTTTITAVTLSQGRWRLCRFTGAATITNGASLVVEGGADFTSVAGQYVLFVGYASNVVRCIPFTTPAATQTLTNKTFDTASNTLKINGSAAGTAGKMIVDSGSAWVETDYTRPPLNINPNWLLDQINEGALYTYSATTAVGPDGWSGSATGAGVFKLRTLADPDVASRKCLEITCTTADASIAAGDNYYIYTAIEGYDAADLSPGTASSSQITMQFKLKSNSVTGVMGVAVQNSAGNRRYIGTITVPDTSENSYSVTLTLDTTGTWLYTTGIGLKLILTLAAGSNFQATAGAWGAGAEQTTSAQANFMSANTNVVYLKRFHVLPGGVALAYSSQDIQRELSKAHRQYFKTYEQGTAVGTNTTAGQILGGNFAAAAAPAYGLRYPVPMRASPTVTTLTSAGTTGKLNDGATAEQTSTTNGAGATGVNVFISAGTLTQVTGHVTANARLA